VGIVFACCALLEAQTSIGIYTGFNRSNTSLLFSSNDNEDLFISNLPYERFVFVVPILHEINKFSGIVLEPSLLSEGSIIVKQMQSGSSYFFNENSIKYLRLPAYFRLRLSYKTFTMYGMAGPSVAYAMEGSYYNWLDNESTSFGKIDFIEENIPRLDYGVSVGMGIEKLVSNTFKINVGFRNYYGLRDITPENDQSTFHQGFSLLMGFYIPLQKKKEKE